MADCTQDYLELLNMFADLFDAILEPIRPILDFISIMRTGKKWGE